eukprot:gb/GFBE01057964.1/.p1 GENE.gb/GFBE01057964.1/~~gb/GFBE01057964.1/.p1  ORF type:complete len:411 (+),score=64.01 gb/GFBE01057964.1/:1-1233(+)
MAQMLQPPMMSLQSLRQVGRVHPDLAKSFQAFMDRQNKYMFQFSDSFAQLQLRVAEQEAKNQTLMANNQMLREQIKQHQPRGGTAGPVRRSGQFELRQSFAALHESEVHSVDVNGSVFASASWDGTINVVDVTARVTKSWPPPTEPKSAKRGLYSVGFAKTCPDIIGATRQDHKVIIWNYNTDLSSALPGHTDEVNDIAFHAEETVMATVSDDKKVIIWDLNDNCRIVRTIENTDQQGYGVTFLEKTNSYLVAACSTGLTDKTRIWDMRDKSVVQELGGHRAGVIGIDASSKCVLATGSDDGTVLGWDARTWKHLFQLDLRRLPGQEVMDTLAVKRIAFNPDGTMLAAATLNGTVDVFDNAHTDTPSLFQPLVCSREDCVFDVAWGQVDGRPMIATASHDRTVKLWVWKD